MRCRFAPAWIALFMALVSVQACLFIPSTPVECREETDCRTSVDRQVCASDGARYFCEAHIICLGLQIDPNGTACDASTCPEYACDIDCVFGSKRDENGCETCECAPNPQSCPSLADCPNLGGGDLSRDPTDFVQDEQGCPTCELVGDCLEDGETCENQCGPGRGEPYESKGLGCELCDCSVRVPDVQSR